MGEVAVDGYACDAEFERNKRNSEACVLLVPPLCQTSSLALHVRCVSGCCAALCAYRGRSLGEMNSRTQVCQKAVQKLSAVAAAVASATGD